MHRRQPSPLDSNLVWSLLPGDPRPALLASDEPFARFVTLTAVLGKPEDDAEVRRPRKAVVDDPRVRALVEGYA